MTKRDELVAWLAELPDAAIDDLYAQAARLRVTMAPAGDGLDDETRAWLDADLTPPLDPYDWGGIDPETVGKPIEWDEAAGAFIVVGGKD
jgi:hypothetical protein